MRFKIIIIFYSRMMTITLTKLHHWNLWVKISLITLFIFINISKLCNLNIIIVDYQDPVKYIVEDIKVDKKIVDLASIILRIEQSIEPKFLKRPLGIVNILF